MAKEKGHKEKLIDEIQMLAQSKGVNTVFTTFLEITANSIAAQMDPEHAEIREARYGEIASGMTPETLEAYARMFGQLCLAVLERQDDPCDILGDIYHKLRLNNEWSGQFFTPDHISRLMAELATPVIENPDHESPVTISEPACGSGTLILGAVWVMQKQQFDFQHKSFFVAQDIDFLAGMMCYIQLSLMGCPGYVVIDDSISHPITGIDPRGLIPRDGPNVWYTPMYFRDVWHWRRLWVQMDCLLFTAAPKGQAETPAPEPPGTNGPALSEGKGGQLTLF